MHSLRIGRIAIVALSVAAATSVSAQTRRALIIGVNEYRAFASASALAASGTGAARTASGRGLISNLQGAVNDAEAVAAILVQRYGFPATEVRVLADTKATRQGILDSLRAMTGRSQPGDVFVMFYAGHGALRRNTLTPGKQLDQTIVPIDANAGVDDIRDKELAALIAPVSERGVIVTLIFDSCNSGSITRGGEPSLLTERWAAVDERDVHERYTGKAPGDVGALVISAAEDTRPSVEAVDADGIRHGLFTAALLSVLQSASPSTPARQVFQAARAVLQGRYPAQEPSIDAGAARLAQPLFGGAADGRGGVTTVAVQAVEGGRVTLQGGLALGLRVGTELKQFSPASKKPARLRVETTSGVATSTALVATAGSDSVRSGMLFTVERWVTTNEPLLRVYVSTPLPTDADVGSAAAEARALRASPAVRWVADPSDVPSRAAGDAAPLLHVGHEARGWIMRGDSRAPVVVLGEKLIAAAVLAAVKAGGAERPFLFVSLPPSTALSAALAIGPGSASPAIVRDSVPGEALYALAGRLSESGVEYAWVRPGASRALDRLSVLPARTRWEAARGAPATAIRGLGTRLSELAAGLGRIRTWLTIQSPPDDGRFPYELAIMDSVTNAPVLGDSLKTGRIVSLALTADSATLASGPPRLKRFVYVFGIDSTGKGTLYFPDDKTNAQNRLPGVVDHDGNWPRVIPLQLTSAPTGGTAYFEVTPGSSLETYLLISSEEAIPPEVFEFAAVRSAGDGVPDGSFAALLAGAGSRTRDLSPRKPPSAPTTWAIQRRAMRIVK